MVNLHLTFACGESSLRIHRFAVNESVSSLFTAAIWAHSPDPHLDFDALMRRDPEQETLADARVLLA